MQEPTNLPRCWPAWRAPLVCAWLALCAPGAAFGKSAVDGEIVVQLLDRAEIAPLLVKHQLSLIGRFGARPIFRLKVIGEAKVGDKITALMREPEVRSAEPNATFDSVQPGKNVAWAIGSSQSYATQWFAQAIRLPQAHQIASGAGIRVAVLDSGVDRRHPALAGRLVRGFDFVDYDNDPSEEGGEANPSFGHGTHVAGLIALVAPDARIMPLRILDADGVGNIWVLAEAMLHAVDPDGDPSTDDGAQVINLSVSSLTRTQFFKTVAKLVSCKHRSLRVTPPRPEADEDDDADEPGETPATFSDKVRCGGFGGAVVVAAAGNRGSDRVHEYPAAERSSALLSVAASEREGRLAPFSNYGWVKLAAPGALITSAVPGGGYGTWSGTSMAAPLVAGAAALLRSADRDLTVDQVVKRLRDRAGKLCRSKLRQLDVAGALGDSSAVDRPDCDQAPD